MFLILLHPHQVYHVQVTTDQSLQVLSSSQVCLLNLIIVPLLEPPPTIPPFVEPGPLLLIIIDSTVILIILNNILQSLGDDLRVIQEVVRDGLSAQTTSCSSTLSS